MESCCVLRQRSELSDFGGAVCSECVVVVCECLYSYLEAKSGSYLRILVRRDAHILRFHG